MFINESVFKYLNAFLIRKFLKENVTFEKYGNKKKENRNKILGLACSVVVNSAGVF